MINKRSYFRISLQDKPFCSSMNIKAINGKVVDSPSSQVCIIDISASGLRFASFLDIPVVKHCYLQFTIRILDKEWRMVGHIVRKAEVNSKQLNYFEYGVQFRIDEESQKRLFQNLNQLNLQLHNFKYAKGCNYCPKMNIESCFYERKIEEAAMANNRNTGY